MLIVHNCKGITSKELKESWCYCYCGFLAGNHILQAKQFLQYNASFNATLYIFYHFRFPTAKCRARRSSSPSTTSTGSRAMTSSARSRSSWARLTWVASWRSGVTCRVQRCQEERWVLNWVPSDWALRGNPLASFQEILKRKAVFLGRKWMHNNYAFRRRQQGFWLFLCDTWFI